MKVYYLCVLRKTSKRSSTYFNAMCSDIHKSRQDCQNEMERRVAAGAEAKLNCVTETEFNEYPVGTLFFHIQEAKLI